MISNFNLKTLILLRKKNVNPVFCKRNGLIELKTALLGCNTNIGLLGSKEQGKNSLFYLLRCVTKSNPGIVHSVPVSYDMLAKLLTVTL
jgi:hypothetical protein